MAEKTLSIVVKAGDQATAVLRNTNQMVLNIGVSVEKTSAKTEEAAGRISKTMDRIKTVFEAVFAYEAIKGGLEVLMHTAETVDEIAKAARRLGVDGTQLSVLKYEGDIAGVSFQELGKALKFAQKNLSDFVETGGGKYEAWSRKFKIDLVDEKGHLRDILTILPQLADRFNTLSPGQATQAATDIFGKSGNSMLQLFRLGGEEMQRLASEARVLNVAFSKEQLDASERMVDATKRVGAAWLGVKATIVTAVEPAITPVLNAIAQKLAALPDITRTVGQNIASAIGGDASARAKLTEFLDSLGSLLETEADQAIKVMWAGIASALTLGWAAIRPDVIRIGKDLIYSIYGGYFGLGEEDKSAGLLGELTGKLQSMSDAIAYGQQQISKTLAAGPPSSAEQPFIQQITDLEEQYRQTQAQLDEATKGTTDRLGSAMSAAGTRMEAAAARANRVVEPVVARFKKAAEDLGQVQQHIEEHSFATGEPSGPSAPEQIGEDAEQAAPKVGKLKNAVFELQNMMAELQARSTSVGDDRMVERMRVMIQQRKEITQAFEQLGGVAYGYVFQLKQVHAQELQAFDTNTDATHTVRDLEEAEKSYRVAVEHRTDAVAAGTITQQQANDQNKTQLQGMLQLAANVQASLDAIAQAHPEMATKLQPILDKAADAAASIRKSLTNIPDNSYLGGMRAAYRDLTNEADNFYKVGYEGTTMLAQGFSQGLASSMVAVMSRTQSFGKAFKQMLRQLLQQVSQLIFQFLILRAIMGVAGAFASAGSATATTGVAGSGMSQIPDIAGPSVGVFANKGTVVKIPHYDFGGIARGGANANYDSFIAALTDGEGVLNRHATRRTGEANIAYANAGGTLVPAHGAASTPSIEMHFHFAGNAQPTPASLKQLEEAATTGVLKALRTSGSYRDRMREVLR